MTKRVPSSDLAGRVSSLPVLREGADEPAPALPDVGGPSRGAPRRSVGWELVAIVAILAGLAINAIVQISDAPGSHAAARDVPAAHGASGHDGGGD